jgi:exopolysaccharide production protein ExoZ
MILSAPALSEKNPPGFLNNLQALRAYAALSVVLVHLGQSYGRTAPFGNYGVDVFFVLSGYLMTRIARTDPSHFFARRLIRIVPIYWLFTLLLFGVTLTVPEMLNTTKSSWDHLWKSLLFVPYRKDNGLCQPLLYLGWTLNYEMFFYVLYAIGIRCSKARAPWITILLVALPAAACALWQPSSLVLQYFGSSIVFEFVLGILVYQVLASAPTPRLWFVKLLLVGACFLGLPYLDHATRASGNLFAFGMPEFLWGANSRLCALGLPAAALVFLAVDLEQQGCQVMNRTILLIGNASYILYLVHPYFLRAGEKAFHLSRVTTPQGKIALLAIILLVAVAGSCTLHLYLEKPIQRLLHRRFLKKPGRNPAPEELPARPISPPARIADSSPN